MLSARGDDADFTTVSAPFQCEETLRIVLISREASLSLQIRCNGETSHAHFPFPSKRALFSLSSSLSLPSSLRIFSANIKIHFSPIFCRRHLYPQMGRKRQSDIRPISRPDRRLRVIHDLDCPRRQETADVTSPTAFRRGKNKKVRFERLKVSAVRTI